MSTDNYSRSIIEVPEAPAILGLTFRRFRGESDYPHMVAIKNKSKKVDNEEFSDTIEDIARSYRHLTNCNPYKDMFFAEINEEIIGYSRVWWNKVQDDNKIIYFQFVHFVHEWRGKGIRRAIVLWNERRIREIAKKHPDIPKFFEAWAQDTETDWISILTGEGYKPIRYFFEMMRPDLENIPDLPLPEGLEIRPVKPEHYRPIWEAAREAFRDEWNEPEWQEEWYNEWLESPTFDPSLWQIAWDGDQIAGMVRSYIDKKENKEYNRKRGYTEDICVRRPWRKRGLAKALIARSFKILKNRGMTEAALGVDTENPSGALQLYKSMGFKMIKRFTTHQKPLVEKASRKGVEQ